MYIPTYWKDHPITFISYPVTRLCRGNIGQHVMKMSPPETCIMRSHKLCPLAVPVLRVCTVFPLKGTFKKRLIHRLVTALYGGILSEWVSELKLKGKQDSASITCLGFKDLQERWRCNFAIGIVDAQTLWRLLSWWNKLCFETCTAENNHFFYRSFN